MRHPAGVLLGGEGMFVVQWMLLGCSPEPVEIDDSTSTPVEPVEPAEPGEPDEDPVLDPSTWEWSACDLVPTSGDGAAECALVTLPLDYEQPTAGTYDALLKRRPGTGPGQLWLMHGGPGGSAVDDLWFLPVGVADARPDLTLYAIDHRGLGGSARLSCPEQEAEGSEAGIQIADAEWPDCAAAMQEEWGPALDLITTTHSAWDVGALIDALAEPDEEVFVYGGSYGTYLAQRYLQLFPEQPSGVILEGISPPGDGFIGYDAGMSDIGDELMALCAAAPSCADHFAGDPVATAQGLPDRFDDGHCAQLGVDGAFVRSFLGSMLFYDKLRDLVPATVFRFDRCDTDDVGVLIDLYYGVIGTLGQTPQPAPWGLTGNVGTGYSQALFYHVALSEMWHEPGEVTPEEAEATWASLTMSTGLETWLADKVDWWPRFPKDELWGRTSDYSGPLLMLQGGLDPATTPGPALALASEYTAPAQTLAYFPEGAHNILSGSMLADGSDCGERLLQDFLADPEAPLDTGCIGETLGVQWDGHPGYNEYWMGTSDIWGDS